MILPLPPRIANDNEAPSFWSCIECDNGAFVLEYENGETTIRCGICRIDVTANIAPTLGDTQCRQ